NIMRDNMIVRINTTCMAMDLNNEHHIGYVKKLHLSKGIHMQWEQLGHVSASIKELMALKHRVSQELDTSHQRRKGKTPDTSSLVWRVVTAMSSVQVQVYKLEREGNSTVKAFDDLHLKGDGHLSSSSVRTFNKKMDKVKAGGAFVPEVDEIGQAEFGNILGEVNEETDNVP
ncbi:hypothetical protein C8J56DRAFT_774167, partial [Mycena floridula]